MLLQLHKSLCITVMSASWSNLQWIGMTTCNFTLSQNPFSYEFILCKNLKRSLILGLDFLKTHEIGTNLPDTGKIYI